MIIKTSLVAQVRHLLSGLSEHGGQHLTEIETDLVQTNILLDEAIEKLSASFMAIHATVTAQQQIVDALLAGTAVTPDAMIELRGQAAQIDRHVNAAVTGLQFQDMTTQLINRTVRRVVGLHDVLEVLGTYSGSIPVDGSDEQMHAALSEINARLKVQSMDLEKELWKAVRQTHMESGEIDLF